MKLSRKRKKHVLRFLYGTFFLYILHYALGLYINSSFLEQRLDESVVGLLFTLASLGSGLVILFIRPISAKLGGSRNLLTAISLLTLASMALFVFGGNPWLIASMFVVYWMLVYLFQFIADIFVEAYSDDETTGGTRGVFLTVAGLGTLLAPLVVSLFLDRPGGFQTIYLGAMCLVAIATIWIMLGNKGLNNPIYEQTRIMPSLKTYFRDKNLVGVFAANMLMQLFYSWMIIYTPIYLSRTIGLPWSQIGVIFAIMLIPFVLFEIPLGKLADNRYGEKEIMLISLAAISIPTALLAFVGSAEAWVWATILFATRTGASGLQVATESYFFKQVDETKLTNITLFRLTGPVAYVVGPLLASALLLIPGFPLRGLFVVLALIMLVGIPLVWRIVDTR